MRAMRAEQFSSYEGLKLVNLPKPAVTDGKVLVRITAAGVTPLDYTILSGKFHGSKPPLVLGNEGAGVVEQGGGTDFPGGSRVMFFGAYGAFEDGSYSEWVAVSKEDRLCAGIRQSTRKASFSEWQRLASLRRCGNRTGQGF
jgi:NADPH2:quinone reductase